ncbi:hypothetical protein L1887_54966 [Cichorium endivia]|nr:hypothetical protein L1887_54966 [Cichorium endivia]
MSVPTMADSTHLLPAVPRKPRSVTSPTRPQVMLGSHAHARKMLVWRDMICRRMLLEGLLRNGTLEALELESVTGGHEVVVRDDLDERLDLGALGNLLGPHALGHLLRVSLDTSGNNVGESLLLGAVIELLDDDNLFVVEAMDAGRTSVKAALKSRCGTNDERAYPRGARAAESEIGQHHSDGNGWRGGCDS